MVDCVPVIDHLSKNLKIKVFKDNDLSERLYISSLSIIPFLIDYHF